METQERNLVVIDVLDRKYYDDCHITGSINIPADELQEKMGSLDKDNLYVVYCAVITCSLSKRCAKLLLDAKFEHVYAYEGGTAEWYQKGYPMQGPAQLEYLHEQISQNVVENHTLPTITAEQLLEKMKQSGLIK